MSPQLTGNFGQAMEDQKIFGIGLSRTGTTSLTHALSILGYHANHLPIDDVTKREFHEYFAESPNNSEPLRLSILDQFDALTDIPVCCVYQGLDRAYPDSKFILTMRDKQSWLASYERLRQQILDPLSDEKAGSRDIVEYLNFLLYVGIARTLGENVAQIPEGVNRGSPYFDRDVFSRLYDAYHEQVREYFHGREDRLLVLRIVEGEGWEKLAPFLDKPIPNETFPFEMKLTDWSESSGDETVGEADREASQINVEVAQAYLGAFQERDVDTCRQYFTDDALVKMVDRRICGPHAIAEWHRDRFENGASILNVGEITPADDTVVLDLTVSSKFLRRWRVKFGGQVVLRFADAKIREMGFQGVRLIR